MTGPWSIFLPGRVPTKGSTEYKGHGKALSTCKLLAPWTGWACAEIVRSNPPKWLAHAPVSVQLQIAIERPSSHFLRSGALSATGRKYPAPTRRDDGDWDKHERAVLDMLVTAGVLADDSQVVSPGPDSWMAWCSGLRAPGVAISVRDHEPSISFVHLATPVDDVGFGLLNTPMGTVQAFGAVSILCNPHGGRRRYQDVVSIVTGYKHWVSCRQCLEIMGKR